MKKRLTPEEQDFWMKVIYIFLFLMLAISITLLNGTPTIALLPLYRILETILLACLILAAGACLVILGIVNPYLYHQFLVALFGSDSSNKQ